MASPLESGPSLSGYDETRFKDRGCEVVSKRFSSGMEINVEFEESVQ